MYMGPASIWTYQTNAFWQFMQGSPMKFNINQPVNTMIWETALHVSS